MRTTRRGIFLFTACVIGLGVAAYGSAIWYVNDVETPDYKVVKRDGAFEIRDYPATAVAEVVRGGDRKTAVNKGFRPLATYIFAKERAGEPIAMTAPVTQASDDAGRTWTVRFVMPAEYTLNTLPVPDNADISIVEIPAGRRAAVRFSGTATD